MKDEMRRRSESESTERNTEEKESRTSSVDAEEKAKRETSMDGEKIARVGQNGTNGITTLTRPRSRLPHTKSLHSTRSHQSRAGADGYTCFPDEADEDQRPNKSTGATANPDEPYLVKWDNGDADPLNPRSMTKLRRWCIVLIVSSCSLCV